MTYPIAGSSTNIDVAYNDYAMPFGIELTSRSTQFAMNNNMVHSIRNVDLFCMFLVGEISFGIDIFRRWGGIGGSIYIPSFPQLERQATSHPHAF